MCCQIYLRAKERVPSHIGRASGTIAVPSAGIVIFQWDNSSWFNSKKLEYEIESREAVEGPYSDVKLDVWQDT